MKRVIFYGAKSLALGMYNACHFLYPHMEYLGFVVKSRNSNPETLAGMPVIELEQLKKNMTKVDYESLCILIATPENLHQEIVEYLSQNGFHQIICMDSHKETILMEKYYSKMGNFQLLHDINVLETDSQEKAKLLVYQAKFYKDRILNKTYNMPKWIMPIQVGTNLTENRVATVCDNKGNNISDKNVNYCELTALYWLWKNGMQESYEYFGLFHYRRVLKLDEVDLIRMKQARVDVILPYPTLHEPNINEHHSRYVKETDWQAMLQAIRELQPNYADALSMILSKEYFYNYNILIASREVMNAFCSWLFPILERTEELSDPKGWERADRYIGYLAENLLTIYFTYNKNNFYIVHTGRIMLT